jgi:hypothetical protein
MAFTTGKEKEVLDQWSFKVTVEFVDVPKEKEEMYWDGIHYFVEFMIKELTAPVAE